MFENNRLDRQAEICFDQDRYNNETVVIIKLPLYLPYQPSYTTFQRVDGKIIINGQIYRYIKRKVINNEMILVCIADKKATELNKSETGFSKEITGLFDNNSSKKGSSTEISFLKLLPVYNNNILSYNFSSYKTIEAQQTMVPVAKLFTYPKEPPVQPPDVA